MATSKKVKIKKYFKYLIKARGKGIYDHLSIFDGTKEPLEINIETQDYDGLVMSQEGRSVSFKNTTLPWKWDYKNKLQTSKFALTKVGENITLPYTNYIYTNVGCTDTNGVISNFYYNRYIDIGSVYAPNNLKFVCLADSTSYTSNHQPLIALKSNDRGFQTRSTTGTWSCYTQDGWVDGVNKLSPYIKYWFGVNMDIENITGYTLEDKGYTLDTLPEFSEWRQEWQISHSYNMFQSDATFTLGNNQKNSSSYWKGNVYLKDFCRIWVDDVVVFPQTETLEENLPGCLHNYTDTGQAVTLNCFAVNGDESVVLTPDEKYGDERFLGTVDIKEHNINI